MECTYITTTPTMYCIDCCKVLWLRKVVTFSDMRTASTGHTQSLQGLRTTRTHSVPRRPPSSSRPWRLVCFHMTATANGSSGSTSTSTSRTRSPSSATTASTGRQWLKAQQQQERQCCRRKNHGTCMVMPKLSAQRRVNWYSF
jgi:hypothetical protein